MGTFPVLPLAVFTFLPLFDLLKCLTSMHIKKIIGKFLHQSYRYHGLRKTFSNFYHRHHELVSKFKVGLKSPLQQGLSEPEFNGDLVYKLKKNVRKADFSDQFKRVIISYNALDII